MVILVIKKVLYRLRILGSGFCKVQAGISTCEQLRSYHKFIMPVHLSKGSQDPPTQEGKLRVYSMRFCPYAQRVHLILLAKKIPNIETFGKLSPAFYKCMMGEGINPSTFGEIVTALEPLEAELKARGTPYLSGSKPGMVDYMIWPWLERLPSLAELAGPEYALPADKFAQLIKYSDLMKEDPAVKEYYLSPEQHAEHIKRRKAGLASAYDL
ncbi:pyrimidodiazepine synthase-like [Diaphorina citri]|uniref:Pyrimidodiazepine synthase-like n=1 Tax=Diaphorina citri TaxID=121845 RepID=A0A3Q0JJD0_DIACI|nr:pyrimidodiazepine synthase-like [Diaphorina citri]